jgi:hypothetical protein
VGVEVRARCPYDLWSGEYVKCAQGIFAERSERNRLAEIGSFLTGDLPLLARQNGQVPLRPGALGGWSREVKQS